MAAFFCVVGIQVWLCAGQSNQAMSVPALVHDPIAAEQVAAQYASDPGASPKGKFITAEEATSTASKYADKVRIMVVGNVATCAAPIPDFYPSIPDPTHPIAHRWTVPTPEFVGLGEDLMGGATGGFSGTCWFYGTELADTQHIPIGQWSKIALSNQESARGH